jgi:hypothetical protein
MEGDCDTRNSGKKCTLTWSAKSLDDFINGLDVDEYYDEDGDYAYDIDVPAHTFELKCKCKKRPKSKQSELVSLPVRPSQSSSKKRA